MSVFSKIMISRKMAKEHKAKQAEKERPASEPAKVPYRHMPTHAAVDALSGAPSSWQIEDKSKIKEHHKRRSQMVISRTGSSISNVSYMNAAAGPSSAPPLPRNSSYSSYNPTWYDRSGDLYYSNESHPNKRTRASRGHSYNDSGIGPSPLASNLQSEDVSPVISSKNSTSSNSSDNLEMRNANRMSSRPQPIVYGEKDIFDRLHTSTTRKLGEAPISTTPQVPKAATPTAVVNEVKPKKQRWSMLGKRQSVAA